MIVSPSTLRNESTCAPAAEAAPHSTNLPTGTPPTLKPELQILQPGPTGQIQIRLISADRPLSDQPTTEAGPTPLRWQVGQIGHRQLQITDEVVARVGTADQARVEAAIGQVEPVEAQAGAIDRHLKAAGVER